MQNDNYSGIIHGLNKNTGSPCHFFLRGDSLEIHLADNTVVNLSYTNTRISHSGVDNKYLNFTGQIQNKPITLLTSANLTLIDLLSIGAPRGFAQQFEELAKAGRKDKMGRLAFLVIGLLIVGTIILIGWIAFSWAVKKTTGLVPVAWESQIGQAAAQDILAEYSVCTDENLSLAMSEMGQRLVGGLDTNRYQWTIRVLDSEEVNAMALPGGYIFIHKGLIDQAKTPEEVAGVLAHEFQHVTLRHGLDNVIRQVGLMIILYAIVGDGTQMEQLLLNNAASFASLSFSREQETQADIQGMRLLQKAKLNPNGLIQFLTKQASDETNVSKAFSYLSTHPNSSKRLEALSKISEQSDPNLIENFRFDWPLAKQACTPGKITDPNAL